MSYRPDPIDPFRRAAEYIDRILKGEKPANLRCRRRRNMSLLSTSRPPRRLALTCRPLVARAQQPTSSFVTGVALPVGGGITAR